MSRKTAAGRNLKVRRLQEQVLSLSPLEVLLEGVLIERFGVLEGGPVTNFVRLAVSPGAIPRVVLFAYNRLSPQRLLRPLRLISNADKRTAEDAEDAEDAAIR